MENNNLIELYCATAMFNGSWSWEFTCETTPIYFKYERSYKSRTEVIRNTGSTGSNDIIMEMQVFYTAHVKFTLKPSTYIKVDNRITYNGKSYRIVFYEETINRANPDKDKIIEAYLVDEENNNFLITYDKKQ